jgi:cobalt-zinc-cadmium efflux system protein
MSHFRKPLAAAVALNTAICATEAAAGSFAGSLSLLMDAIHNLSDELALVFLLAALLVSHRPSSNLVRAANFMNSVGLLVVSALIAWQAIDRTLHPTPVLGAISVAFGLIAALGNWGVARLLREPAMHRAAIRLAYLHNLGDVYVSLAPVAAGLLIALSGYTVVDPLVALLIAAWFMVGTARELRESHQELIWPTGLTCCHVKESGAP